MSEISVGDVFKHKETGARWRVTGTDAGIICVVEDNGKNAANEGYDPGAFAARFVRARKPRSDRGATRKKEHVKGRLLDVDVGPRGDPEKLASAVAKMSSEELVVAAAGAATLLAAIKARSVEIVKAHQAIIDGVA